MTEVLFYHLMHRPLEAVLPGLLEKCLERGWRVVVQAGSDEHCAALDALLWTYRDDSFLPHGTASDGRAAEQPIYLTVHADNPNAATVRFIVDPAVQSELSPYDRVVYLFDGHDPAAVTDARERWKEAKAAGYEPTYWQQSDRGGWERKA